MPTVVSCGNVNCGQKYKLIDELNNRYIKCKSCGSRLVASVNGSTSDNLNTLTESQCDNDKLQSGSTGGKIGRFVLRERLGAGASGTVFRAYDHHLDRDVALKIPNQGVTSNENRITRFLREAKAAANLRHPHIVPIFDAGQDGQSLYIASAFIDGKPLSDVIPEGGGGFFPRRSSRS